MKGNLIQVIDITGSVLASYQLDYQSDLHQLYKGQLFTIYRSGLASYGDKLNSQNQVLEENRFVLAKDNEERQILLNVEPVQCFLHFNDSTSKKINLNPYQSVRWLKNLIQSDRKFPIRLTINNQDLTEETESLIKYIYENAIIHVNQTTQTENIISQMRVKEPGTQSKVYIVNNIGMGLKIDELVRKVSQVTTIPYEFLHLVYGGKILLKDNLVSDYPIQAKGFLYAVDSRKFMKRVSLNQYQKRQSQIKQMKQNNKAIIHKLKQQIQKQKHHKGSPHREPQNSPQQNKIRYITQKSGGLDQNQQDTNQYFKKPMSIQYQQQNPKPHQQVAQQPTQGSNPQLQRLNSELKHGRIVTKQQQVYEDQQGLIHQHKKQKSLYRNGQRIISQTVTQDQEGNIIQKSKDIINIRRDSSTGQITKIQTDIIENLDNTKTIIKKQEVRDSQGNLIKFGTSRITQNLQELSGTIVSNQNHEPITSQHREVSIDSMGNIHTRQKQIIQNDNRTTFLDKNTFEDSKGHIIIQKTNITQIQGDGQGNVQKHKSQLVQKSGKIFIVQTDEIIDADGQVIRKQKETIQIENRQDGTVVKKQTDVIEQEGYTQIVKKGVIQDQYGNVIKSQTKVIDIEGSDYNINVHEREELIEAIQDGEQVQQGEIQKQVRVIQDQQGNTITLQKEMKENQSGHATLIDRYIVENPQGQVVREQTQTIQLIDGEQAPQIKRYLLDYSQTDNKAVMIQKITTQNMDGSVIRSQKQTVQVQQLLDGSIHKKQTQVIAQQGRKMIYVRNSRQDQTGKLISKTSDIMEVSGYHPQNALQYGVEGYNDSVQISTTNRRYDYDADGNLCITQTHIVNAPGQQNVTQRQFTIDQEGRVIQTQTGITERQENSEGQVLLKAADIYQLGNRTTVVETNRILDSDGNQIRKQEGTLRIQQVQGGVYRQKQTLTQQNGVKRKVYKEAFQDQQGNTTQQKLITTEYDDDQGNRSIVEKYTRKSEQVQQDNQGNYYLREKQVVDDEEGKVTVIQSQVIRDKENSLVQATTDVVQLELQQDGTFAKHEVNIIEKPGKVTVAESQSIQNASGQKLEGQVQSVVLTQGPNDSIIRQQTNIVMSDYEQKIVQKITVEDRQGNILNQQGKAKRIYIDEDGNQQQRQIETYEIVPDTNNQGQSYQERQVIEDQYGNISTKRRQIIQNQDSNLIIETETVKNAQGQIIRLNKNVIQTQEMQQGLVSTQNKEILQNEKVITTQIVTLSNLQGEVFSERQKRCQITQDEGLIRTSKFDIIREEGKTIVGVVNTLQDQQGNLVDTSSNIIKIRDSQQAVRQHAKRIAKAQIQGKVTQFDKNITEDEAGNSYIIEKQIIQDEGKTILVDTETIKSPEGDIIHSVTGITEQKLEDGKVKVIKTEITQNDGEIKVVEVVTAKDQGYMLVDRQQQQEGENQELVPKKIEIKQTHSITNSDQVLIQASSPYKTQQQSNQTNQQLPEQYMIIAVDKHSNQIPLLIRYDDIVDEIAGKLSQIIRKPKQVIKFYKDGVELSETQCAIQLEIYPGSVVYFIDEE